ncbi:hypothetical protein EI94DRAFT_1797233 [Lactarius quietus]|nr:hypothetical protein EI94DRAFT_1797233 [Lactarius quietus]
MEQPAGVWDTQVEKHVSGDDDTDEDSKAMRPALDDRASYLSVTDSRPSTPAWGKGSLDPWTPPALTSSSDSLTTPSTSSESPSIPQATAPTPLNTYHNTKESIVSAIIPDFVRTSPVPSPPPVTHAPNPVHRVKAEKDEATIPYGVILEEIHIFPQVVEIIFVIFFILAIL